MIDSRRGAVSVGAALLLALLSDAAHAEPQFTVRTGLRCARCHTTPTGGGKRTPFGALWAQTNLTLGDAAPRVGWSEGVGSGRGATLASLAVGEVTPWLAVGADLRLTYGATFLPGGERQNSFDATAGAVYLELRPWPDRVTLYLDEELAMGGARNREAWVMIHGPWGSYLRGGRLLIPFGLRIVDDAAYTRRATGVNFASPDLGLELGLDRGPLFAAVALTNGTFSGAGDTDKFKALSGLVELHLGPGRIGLSGAYNPTDQGNRGLAAAFGGLRLWRLALQGEIDLVAQRPADKPRWAYGLAALVEAELLLWKGLALRASWDIHDPDWELHYDRRQRFRVGLDVFAVRGVVAKLFYVRKQSETVDPADRARILEVVLHGYL